LLAFVWLIGSTTDFHLQEVLLHGDSHLHSNSFFFSFFGLQPPGYQNRLGTSVHVLSMQSTSDCINLGRWLLAHGKEEEAIEVLSCLEAKPIDDPLVITQRNEIAYSIEYEKQNAIRWRDLLKKDKKTDTKTLRRLFLGIGTQFMQQFGGINVMSYYMPTVLTNSVGLPEKMARLLSACNAVSYLIFSGLAVLFVERMGRRVLMLSSTVAQFVCFLIITILLYFSEGGSSNGQVYANASVAFFFLYYGAFGIGMLGVPWLYPTEINSLPMRTKGAAAATATNWYVY
jgi:hypothetical protein